MFKQRFLWTHLTLTLSPLSLRTTTACSAFKSRGPTSIRRGTPCTGIMTNTANVRNQRHTSSRKVLVGTCRRVYIRVKCPIMQVRAYLGSSSMSRVGVFLLPPGWDASPSQGYPPALNSLVPIYTSGCREGLWEYEVYSQEHDTMSSARARTFLERVNRIPLIPSGWISSQVSSYLCSLP